MKLEESSKKKFYQWLPEERRAFLTEKGIKLSEIDSETLERLDQLSENVIGQVRLPLGVLPKLIVNGKDYQVPMAVEEPSVVAAANHAAKIFNQNGGAVADSKRNGIYGQIVLEVTDNFDLTKFTTEFPQLISLANKKFVSLVKHGGGVRKIEASQKENLVFLRVLVDPAEAMGANKTNAILEFLGKQMYRHCPCVFYTDTSGNRTVFRKDRIQQFHYNPRKRIFQKDLKRHRFFFSFCISRRKSLKFWLSW